MNASEIETETIAVIGMFADALPEGQAADFQDIARHNECVVALEMLCDQLYEHSVPLSRLAFDRIQELGTEVGLDSTYLTSLSALTVPPPGI